MNTSESEQSIDDGGPAFPCENDARKEYNWIKRGMSLRDWFASQALQGLMVDYYTHGNTILDCVMLAMEAADAMIAARKGEQP